LNEVDQIKSSSIDVIAFDADDTLWENEHFYSGAKARFIQLLAGYQDTDTIEAKLNETEIYNIRYYGYGIKSFVLSMIETGVKVTNGSINGSEILQIIDLAKDVLTAEIELFDHVKETLPLLAAHYDLMLITKGEQWEQERKILRSNLSDCFRYIEIVGDKNENTYLAILSKYNLKPTRFWMVGNSIKSDIEPVLKIGGQAVLIPYANTWFHEMETTENLDTASFTQLEHVGLLPDFFARLEGSD
jgi:putative hydrolase of the HAD superfamily